MFFWVFRLLILFAILTLVYVVLAQYSRWNRRKTLEAEYDASEIREGEREDYVADGMARYERSMSKRLLLGVFLIPLGIVAILLLLANFT